MSVVVRLPREGLALAAHPSLVPGARTRSIVVVPPSSPGIGSHRAATEPAKVVRTCQPNVVSLGKKGFAVRVEIETAIPSGTS
ncbi:MULTISPECIES: hypothetical protein [unclassified Amycolatopsis]|uniref:hypothetical protein n=1 Tax=unclassified Amycolatopsis TaxID=2618356 RepID=UPI0018F421A2|nr:MULTISPECIES: hypothetical protein [unclassified Amycolatopsis]